MYEQSAIIYGYVIKQLYMVYGLQHSMGQL